MDGTVEHGYAEVTRSRHWRSVDMAGDDQVGRGQRTLAWRRAATEGATRGACMS